MERGCPVPITDHCRDPIPGRSSDRTEIWQEEHKAEPNVNQLCLQTLQQCVYEQHLRPLHENSPQLHRVSAQRFTSARERLCPRTQPCCQDPSFPCSQRPLQVPERFPAARKLHRGSPGHLEFYHPAEAGGGHCLATARLDHPALAHQGGTSPFAQVHGGLC